MAGFQIRTKEGEALSMGELDKEAAAFWGKEVHQKSYADPSLPFTNPDNLEGIELTRAQMCYEFEKRNNWFDAIGWYIAESKEIAYPEDMSWKHVIAAMIGDSCCNYIMDKTHQMLDTPVIEGIQAIMDYYRPYTDLIKHWADKGYTPHRV